MISILTYEQAVATSDRQHAASSYLAKGGFYAQAVARAYYSVYTLVNFVARRRPDWPWPAYHDGSPKRNLSHEGLPPLVLLAMQATPGHSLDPRTSRVEAEELLKQRVFADYFGYEELKVSTARELLESARAIRAVLLETASQHRYDALR